MINNLATVFHALYVEITFISLDVTADVCELQYI